jgi:hypothetical protein
MVDEFCFCTLAVGARYRNHAQILASDIQRYSPKTSFVVLTDQPADFKHYPHVITSKHRLQSMKGYHDKRFVIEKALELFDICLYLDSDVRIVGSVPTTMEWLPGITARTGCNILKHNSDGRRHKALSVIKEVAHKLDVKLEETQWFHEFMFAVKKQAGAEAEFLRLWQTISYFFEMQGLYGGEGDVMGLAAAKAGLSIRFDTEDRFPFFKDKIEQVRINCGQSSLEDKRIYFETHEKIEYPNYSIWRRGVEKLMRRIAFLHRLLKLKYLSKKKLEFQKLV